MKIKKQIGLVLGTLLMMCVLGLNQVAAQCAMCSLNAENSVKDGNGIGNGLNDGILFLLAIPYVVAIGIGILWYKKYRKAQVKRVSPFDLHK